MLNPDSPIPLYFQLAEVIQNKISSGNYTPGMKIQSENELSEIYKIGRPTVRQGIDILVRKNILEKRKGSGTYVKAARIEVDLFSLAGTSAAFQKSGIVVKTEYLTTLQPLLLEEKADNPMAGKRVYFLSRLENVDENPVLIEDIYINTEIFPGIDKYEFNEMPLSKIVEEKYFTKPSGGKQTFGICLLSGLKREKLKILDDMPVLLVKRWIHFNHAENAIYSEIYCRTDKFVFSQNIIVP